MLEDGDDSLTARRIPHSPINKDLVQYKKAPRPTEPIVEEAIEALVGRDKRSTRATAGGVPLNAVFDHAKKGR